MKASSLDVATNKENLYPQVPEPTSCNKITTAITTATIQKRSSWDKMVYQFHSFVNNDADASLSKFKNKSANCIRETNRYGKKLADNFERGMVKIAHWFGFVNIRRVESRSDVLFPQLEPTAPPAVLVVSAVAVPAVPAVPTVPLLNK